MKRLFALSCMLVLAGALVVPASASARPSAGRYIVVLHDFVDRPGAVASHHARSHGAEVSRVYRHALKGYAARMTAAAAARVATDRRVAYVEADQRVRAFVQTTPTGIDRAEADKELLADIDASDDARVNVDIAVLDTGIGPHGDLNVAGGWNCAKRGPFNTSCDVGGYEDGNGHGTHVAGTAAAIDNDSGVVGIAPGGRLWAVRVLDNNGSGYISWIVAGIDKVTANASTIDVANMSLGCECSSDAMDDAIARSTQAGVVYVVAAGNSGADAATHSPANHPDVISVSAVADYDGKAGGAASPTCRDDSGADDSLATWSNYGAVVDLAAPGVCILSTTPNNGFDTYSGTSMASPHVAGAAALYVVANGKPTNATGVAGVKSGLQGTGWSVAQSDTCGFSGDSDGSAERLLMLEACDVAGSGGTTPSNSSPTASFTHSCTQLSCSFDGSGSSDTDGVIAGYAWDFGDGSTATGATASHTYAVAGTYTVTLTVTDDDGATDSESKTFSVSSSTSSSATVAAVTYSTNGGKNNNLHLSFTVTVVDGEGNPVANASVSVELWTDDGDKVIEPGEQLYASGSGTTGSDGKVTFKANNAPSGCYTTKVTDVTATGMSWDGATPTNGACK